MGAGDAVVVMGSQNRAPMAFAANPGLVKAAKQGFAAAGMGTADAVAVLAANNRAVGKLVDAPELILKAKEDFFAAAGLSSDHTARLLAAPNKAAGMLVKDPTRLKTMQEAFAEADMSLDDMVGILGKPGRLPGVLVKNPARLMNVRKDFAKADVSVLHMVRILKHYVGGLAWKVYSNPGIVTALADAFKLAGVTAGTRHSVLSGSRDGRLLRTLYDIFYSDPQRIEHICPAVEKALAQNVGLTADDVVHALCAESTAELNAWSVIGWDMLQSPENLRSSRL